MSLKNMNKLVIFSILFAFTLPVYAKPGGVHHSPKENHVRKQSQVNTQWEKKADKNNDGFVDKSESTHWKETHHDNPKNKPPLKDVNGDGNIDRADKNVMINSTVNTPDEAKIDQDHSGYVDKYEKRKADEIKNNE